MNTEHSTGKKEEVTFPQRLGRLMGERNLKPAALAREIGISHVAVKNYLEGRIPDTKLLFQIAKFFGVTMEYLLNGTSSEQTGWVGKQESAASGDSPVENSHPLKNGLVSEMNYEFRAPLNGVLGFTDLLSTTPLNKEQKEHLNMIRESGNVLLGKLNDILEMSASKTARTNSNVSQKSKDSDEDNTPTRKALIVEDEPTSRHLLTMMLKNLGIKADCAHDGKVCLEMYQRTPYDLIFMDVRLPGMDGVEATRRIREAEKNTSGKKTHIIAITAQAMPGDEAQCLAAGMNDYISKPVRFTDIKRALEKV